MDRQKFWYFKVPNKGPFVSTDRQMEGGNYNIPLKKCGDINVFLPYLKFSDLLPETYLFFLFGLKNATYSVVPL